MPTPSDSTLDFKWLKRQLGDSAVLPAPSDGPESVDEPVSTGEETHVLEPETVIREPHRDPLAESIPESSSRSGIHDVKVSDASILEDDAPSDGPSAGEASDVILRNQLPDEENRQVPVESDDESIDEVLKSAVQPELIGAPDATPTPGPIFLDIASGDKEPVKAFDLETPLPTAEFPAPYNATEVFAASRPGTQPSSAGNSPDKTALPDKASFGRIALISYASAMTLVSLFLLLQLLREFRPHQLESLPDVPPLQEGESKYYPVDAILPDGHLLTLGGSRRFGDILVEPLRVTYGPLEYEHWTGEASRQRPASEQSVVKLWIRFTNLSQDQPIAPFDPRLVLESRYRSGEMLTNNFLRRADSSELELMYDLPPASEWELRDQQIGEVLQPGESFETYAATDSEHLDEIIGQVGSDRRDLVWRLHIRKGFGPGGNGVTTLVDVAFNSSAIEPEG